MIHERRATALLSHWLCHENLFFFLSCAIHTGKPIILIQKLVECLIKALTYVSPLSTDWENVSERTFTYSISVDSLKVSPGCTISYYITTSDPVCWTCWLISINGSYSFPGLGVAWGPAVAPWTCGPVTFVVPWVTGTPRIGRNVS